MSTKSGWLSLVPALFVLLWSTGFIGAKWGLPDAEPLTFLAVRFAIASLGFALLALVLRRAWPRRARTYVHLFVIGFLIHAVYLGAVFAAIDQGVSAGVSALIVGIQPLLVAIGAGWILAEKVTARQWIGLLLGLIGVGLVVTHKLDLNEGTLFAMGLCVLGLFAITAATLYQKRVGAQSGLIAGNAVQFFSAALACALGAMLFERGEITWSGNFIFALSWLVLVLSFGAISLLYVMIREGAASKVSSLFYLVPPTTALLAWPLFGESLEPQGLLGMAVAVIGVALVNLPTSKNPSPQNPALPPAP